MGPDRYGIFWDDADIGEQENSDIRYVVIINTCDKDMYGAIWSQFSHNSEHFIYWLLNNGFPSAEQTT